MVSPLRGFGILPVVGSYPDCDTPPPPKQAGCMCASRATEHRPFKKRGCGALCRPGPGIHLLNGRPTSSSSPKSSSTSMILVDYTGFICAPSEPSTGH